MVQRGFEAEAAFANEKLITFKVGPNGNAVFLVPEDRIRASSEFADAAMKGPWQESQQRSISLPDFEKHTFGIYLHWLLTGVVHSRQSHVDPFVAQLRELMKLPELFALGHYTLDTDFRDALSDSLMQCTSEMQYSFPPDYGSKFYKNIPDGSPTRKLVADLIAWTMDKYDVRTLAANRDTMEPDLITDILLAFCGRYIAQPPSKSPLDGWKTSCKYHCHGDEKPCYRNKAETLSILATKRAAPDDAESPDAKRRA